jgi:hypothetical protein
LQADGARRAASRQRSIFSLATGSPEYRRTLYLFFTSSKKLTRVPSFSRLTFPCLVLLLPFPFLPHLAFLFLSFPFLFLSFLTFPFLFLSFPCPSVYSRFLEENTLLPPAFSDKILLDQVREENFS